MNVRLTQVADKPIFREQASMSTVPYFQQLRQERVGRGSEDPLPHDVASYRVSYSADGRSPRPRRKASPIVAASLLSFGSQWM